MVPDVTLLKSKQTQQINELPNINSATPSPGSLVFTSSPESLSGSSPCAGSSLPSSPDNAATYNNNNSRNNDHHSNKVSYPQNISNYHLQQSFNHYHRQSRLRINLVKSQLLTHISQNETLIIIGETGSGKTTQIPQFVFEFLSSKHHQMTTSSNGIRKCFKGIIGITQPRRIAAVSIATRVASEMKTQLGDLVGYKIRFEDYTSPRTKVKYMTDGILLREAINDPLLSNYRVIILDEAHERTVQSDVLFGIIKKAQRLRNQKRPLEDNNQYHETLKIIIMSATMDVDNFSRYFINAPVYYVEGRVHPIEIFYTETKQNDYIMAALSTLFQIHQQEDELTIGDDHSKHDFSCIGGDILVFCTGQEEIESMIKNVNDLSPQINSTMKTSKGTVKTLKAYPLYSALPTAKQQKIFVRNPNDCFRRVIFATNIAETSITIPNIRYVIDSGKVKSRFFSPKTGFEIMNVENISKAQACQRSGRAGRLAPGKCYRLYTRSEYRTLPPFPVPEIQKCNLSNVLLQLIASGISNVQEFDFIDPPSFENIQSSVSQLLKMKAIEKVQENENSNNESTHYKLTNIGRLMVTFPVDPRFALLIIVAQKFRCTEEIITIIAMLSVDNVFINNINSPERETVLAMHRKFASSEGDLIKLLNVFRRYKEAKQTITWCQENFLRPVQLKTAVEIRQQLMELCRLSSIQIVSSQNTETVRKCLAIGAGVGIGLGANVAFLQREGGYRIKQFSKTQQNELFPLQTVYIHPTSCLFSHKPECVLFVEMVQTSKSFMKNICLIDQEWLLEKSSDDHSHNI